MELLGAESGLRLKVEGFSSLDEEEIGKRIPHRG